MRQFTKMPKMLQPSKGNDFLNSKSEERPHFSYHTFRQVNRDIRQNVLPLTKLHKLLTVFSMLCSWCLGMHHVLHSTKLAEINIMLVGMPQFHIHKTNICENSVGELWGIESY